MSIHSENIIELFTLVKNNYTHPVRRRMKERKRRQRKKKQTEKSISSSRKRELKSDEKHQADCFDSHSCLDRGSRHSYYFVLREYNNNIQSIILYRLNIYYHKKEHVRHSLACTFCEFVLAHPKGIFFFFPRRHYSLFLFNL